MVAKRRFFRPVNQPAALIFASVFALAGCGSDVLPVVGSESGGGQPSAPGPSPSPSPTPTPDPGPAPMPPPTAGAPGPFAQGFPRSLVPTDTVCRARSFLQGGTIVYNDSGVIPGSYTVRSSRFEATTNLSGDLLTTCRVADDGPPNSERVVLATGDIEYRTTVTSNFTSYEKLTVNAAGSFVSCSSDTGGRAGSERIVCGEVARALPGLRAPRATAGTFSSVQSLFSRADGFFPISSVSASQNARLVAWEEPSQAGESQITVLNRDSGVRTAHAGTSPKLSGNGRYVLVATSGTLAGRQAQLKLIDLQGGPPIELGQGVPASAQLSDDGAVIALEQISDSGFGEQYNVIVFNRLTGQQWQYGNDARPMAPRMTRNGRFISFVATVPNLVSGAQGGGFRLDTQSGQLSQIVAVTDTTGNLRGLVSAENGQSIVYADSANRAFVRRTEGGPDQQIFVDYVRDPVIDSLVYARGDSALVFKTNQLMASPNTPISELSLLVLYELSTASFRAWERPQTLALASRNDAGEFVLSGLNEVVVVTP